MSKLKPLKEIEKYLMSRIDTSNPVEVEKVSRYVKHIKMYREMSETVREEGYSLTTENGSQSFTKSHPLLNDMNKINAAIINIEKTFNFIDEGEEEKYTASDLI